MIAELQRKGYDSDPVKTWKKLQDLEAALVCIVDYFHSLLRTLLTTVNQREANVVTLVDKVIQCL